MCQVDYFPRGAGQSEKGPWGLGIWYLTLLKTSSGDDVSLQRKRDFSRLLDEVLMVRKFRVLRKLVLIVRVYITPLLLLFIC